MGYVASNGKMIPSDEF